MDFDLIIKNCIIVTAAEILPEGLSIGIKSGKISCIGSDLHASQETRIIDAEGAYVTPGGVDSHAHLAQDNAPTGDTWETGTRSAIAGGTTTVLAFASQKKSEESLFPIVEEYHRRSNRQAYCDYGFHVIVSNLTDQILESELKELMNQGITSLKLYMTYPLLRLGDSEMMELLIHTRALGMTTMVHAENADMIDVIARRLLERGHNEPYFHSVARPQIAETEATYRAISIAEVCDAPILIVHMSSDASIKHVRDAQTKNLPIHAETCPHYLYLLSEKIAAPDFEGAKHVCAPPLRHSTADLDALWSHLSPPSPITVISSDHAPHTYDHSQGKKRAINKSSNPPYVFSSIPNGLPGLETRLPLLFHAATGPNPRISLPRFVELTSTNPAKLYGLDGVKGSIAPGYEADLTIWHPEDLVHRNGFGFVIRQDLMHHAGDYTPFEGMVVRNWPRFTILRGNLVWDKDGIYGKGLGIVGEKGDGKFLKRGKGKLLVGKTGHTGAGMKDGERALWME